MYFSPQLDINKISPGRAVQLIGVRFLSIDAKVNLKEKALLSNETINLAECTKRKIFPSQRTMLDTKETWKIVLI